MLQRHQKYRVLTAPSHAASPIMKYLAHNILLVYHLYGNHLHMCGPMPMSDMQVCESWYEIGNSMPQHATAFHSMP